MDTNTHELKQKRSGVSRPMESLRTETWGLNHEAHEDHEEGKKFFKLVFIRVHSWFFFNLAFLIILPKGFFCAADMGG